MKGRSKKGRGGNSGPKETGLSVKEALFKGRVQILKKEKLTINFKVLCLLPGPRVSKVSIHPE